MKLNLPVCETSCHITLTQEISNINIHSAADLKDENVKLKERNRALRDYIDQLLLAVIDVKPDLLEVKPSSSHSLHSSPSLHHGVMSNSS